MLNIGIMTLFGDNYGAVLQAYALCTKLSRMGHNAKIIHYNDVNRVRNGLSTWALMKHTLRKFLCFVLTGNKKHLLFEQFRNQHMNFSPYKIKTRQQLRQANLNFDIYLSGSDQIWNPSVCNNDKSYLLDFVPQNVIRVAYASSFGTSTLSENVKKEYGPLLRKYKVIGVRERSGLDITRSICDVHAEHVIDPTLLLDRDEWISLLSDYRGKYVKKHYVLCYIMPGDRAVCNCITQVSKHIATLYNAQIIIIGVKEYQRFTDNVAVDACAGPLDFIALFSNAIYVITNSFHGTAFAINFNTNFYVVINNDLPPDKARHERILSLLDMMDMQSRILYTGSVKLDALQLCDVNHIAMQKRLEDERNRSIEFIRKYIG